MTMNDKKRISDLALSAFLNSIGHEILGIESEGKRAIFVFQNSSKLENDTLRFFNRKGSVDALTFSESFRNLKAIVKNQS